MRVSLIFFLLLVLFTAGAPAGQGQAATVKKPSSSQQQSPLKGLIAEYDTLSKDQARAGRRDLWLALEGKFDSLRAASKGETAAVAALYHARTRQELARRSFLASDYKEAAKRYQAVAAAYPKSDVVPESLYRQASILTYRLNDHDEAVELLETIIREYPKAKEIAEAKELLARAQKKTGGKPAAKEDAGRASPRRGAKKAEPAVVMEQLGLTVQTIMLDAGHGGKDPGAQGAGIVEKRFTLAMAKRIGDLLQKQGFTVIYTRSTDTFISLQDRPDMANNKKADLFISVHVNANKNAGIRGLETYYLDEAKNQDAVTVAARENAVSVKNISDLQFILTDLMLSSKLKESHHLADCVHAGILKCLRGAKLAAPDNGVRSAPFYVLMGARMPAILVEFGYITNSKDAANLQSDAFLQRQAEGVVQGVLQYKAELAKSVPR